MTSERVPRAEASDTHRLVLRLGHGGTAQVYLALQHGAHGVDKLVVLKVLHPTLTESDEARQMLLDEARLSARLNHANIVQTSGVVQGALGPAMVMEYLDGQSLSSLRARGALPLTLHLRIIIEALRGLHHVHELCDHEGQSLGLIHRDVSPQNVFVTYDGQVKLIDFGIAKRAGLDRGTGIGVIKGKIRYMPPEQMQGVDIDRRVDVYAAGVMLWEAAAGVRMWKGLEEVTVVHCVLTQDIPPIRTVNPEVPEELERIVMKAMAFDRADRYATAADLEADLEAFLARSSPVTNRDIGRFVSETFAETRAETRRIIDQHLTERASWVPIEQAAPREEPPLLRTSITTRSTSAIHSEATRVERVPSRRGSRLWGAALLVLALGMVFLLAPQLRRGSAGGGSVASAQPAQGTTSAGSPSAAPVPVPASPAPSTSDSAESAPAARQSPSAPTGAVASASAPVPGSRGRVTPRTPATTTPSTEPSSPKPSCDPPFTVDASGTKHFKLECL